MPPLHSAHYCLTPSRSQECAPRRSVEPGLRCNLVIALGDLALRFPNLLEPWTEHIYRPLGDTNTAVRAEWGPSPNASLLVLCSRDTGLWSTGGRSCVVWSGAAACMVCQTCQACAHESLAPAAPLTCRCARTR